MAHMSRVVLIGSTTPSNAYLAHSLRDLGIIVLHYVLPKTTRIEKLLSEAPRAGLVHSVGMAATASCMKLERIIERASGRTLWNKLWGRQPSWQELGVPIVRCRTEAELYPYVDGADCVVLLEGYRLGDRFFRHLARPALQIVDGVAPEYMGNAGLFWAYAVGDEDNIGKSIICRRARFTKFELVCVARIRPCPRETIRSLQIKGTMALATVLGDVIERHCRGETASEPAGGHRLLSSPHIVDYLEAIYLERKRSEVPSYAKRNAT